MDDVYLSICKIQATFFLLLNNCSRISMSLFYLPFTDYGKEVKKKLIELDKSQTWLIEQVKEKTGMFVDCSVLNKVLTDRLNSKPIKTAINEILGIEAR